MVLDEGVEGAGGDTGVGQTLPADLREFPEVTGIG
jgi:hypothetical protein